MKTALGAFAVSVLAGITPLLHAADAQDDVDLCAPAAPCRIASAAQLDELRGGFDVDTASGRLRVGIGITRSVSLNDRVVAVSQLTVPDLGRTFEISRHPGQHDLRVIQSGGALIVQNGPGNLAPPPTAFGASALPTIVQNTIDNQKLGTLTIVNAWVNSLSLLRTLRMGEMLGRATAASGR